MEPSTGTDDRIILERSDERPSQATAWPMLVAIVATVAAALVFAFWHEDPTIDPAPGGEVGAPDAVAGRTGGLDVAEWFGRGVRLNTAGSTLWAYEHDTGRLARLDAGSWRAEDPPSDDPPHFLTSASVAWVEIDPLGRVWMSGYAAVESEGRVRRYEASIWYDDGTRWTLLPPPGSAFGAAPVTEIAFAPDGETAYLVVETWSWEETGGLRAWDGAGYRQIDPPPGTGSADSEEGTHLSIRELVATADGTVWAAFDQAVGWDQLDSFVASYDPSTERWSRADAEIPAGWVDSLTGTSTGELWAVVESPPNAESGWALVRRSSTTGSWTTFHPQGPPPMAEVLAADASSVWLQGWDGLGVLRLDEAGLAFFLHGRPVADLAVAADGTVWVVFGDEPGVHRLHLPTGP